MKGLSIARAKSTKVVFLECFFRKVLKMEIETISYQGWENCYRLNNGTLEVIVTADVGPRIIHFGFIGGENVFKQFPDDMGQKGGNEYRFYGGHRIWHAPENRPRTYAPDNDPVDHFELDGIHYFV